jgi:hypothetical protein
MASKPSSVIDQQPTLQPETEVSSLPARVEGQATGMSMFERMASDPSVDVNKLEKLMELHERALARNAKEQFNAAMSAAQKRMRPIAADANNPQTRSQYASYHAIDKALRPIYTDNGFALSFGTDESPLAEHVRVLCYVSHAAGHERTYHVDMPADGKGAKGGDVMTKTHAAGAAMSYGMRYLLKLIFNVAVGEDDTDGNTPALKPAPAGFDQWLADLEATADTGWPALKDAWNVKTEKTLAYRIHLTSTDPQKWEALKTKAAKVKA